MKKNPRENWERGHTNNKPAITSEDRRRILMARDTYEPPYRIATRCVKKNGVWVQASNYEVL